MSPRPCNIGVAPPCRAFGDRKRMLRVMLACKAVSSSLIHCGVLHTVTFAPLAACAT